MQNHRLIKFRETIGETKDGMAEKLGISTSYYEKIEKGERNPSYNFIKKFKNKFPDADVDELFFNTKLHVKCKNKSTA